jgi:hypothetical protein
VRHIVRSNLNSSVFPLRQCVEHQDCDDGDIYTIDYCDVEQRCVHEFSARDNDGWPTTKTTARFCRIPIRRIRTRTVLATCATRRRSGTMVMAMDSRTPSTRAG